MSWNSIRESAFYHLSWLLPFITANDIISSPSYVTFIILINISRKTHIFAHKLLIPFATSTKKGLGIWQTYLKVISKLMSKKMTCLLKMLFEMVSLLSVKWVFILTFFPVTKIGQTDKQCDCVCVCVYIVIHVSLGVYVCVLICVG